MTRFLLVCLFGALGSGLRYLVGLAVGARLATGFPVATLIVNVTGCFLMALVMHLGVASTTLSPTLRIAITTGFLGGLTTYSAFNHETTALLDGGATGLGLVNVGVTLAACFAAGLLGLALGRALTS